jgi:hypothetical protein
VVKYGLRIRSGEKGFGAPGTRLCIRGGQRRPPSHAGK